MICNRVCKEAWDHLGAYGRSYYYMTFNQSGPSRLQVGHLEPWEKNSRKLASQIGHAGEVSGCYGNSPLQPFVALS
jgi:hypothetical protein